MNRLTYKLDEPIKTLFLNYEYKRIPDYDIDRGNFGRITDDMIFNKLGQLEDIEEEIGIDLYTLFRIIKCGQLICKFRPMYDPKKTILISRKINSLYYDGSYYKLEIDEDGDDGYIIQYDVYLKDYGITWAINKWELEKDENNK